MRIAHVEASNVVPSLMTSWSSENAPEKVAGNTQKETYLRTFPKGMAVDLKNFLRA